MAGVEDRGFRGTLTLTTDDIFLTPSGKLPAHEFLGESGCELSFHSQAPTHSHRTRLSGAPGGKTALASSFNGCLGRLSPAEQIELIPGWS